MLNINRHSAFLLITAPFAKQKASGNSGPEPESAVSFFLTEDEHKLNTSAY